MIPIRHAGIVLNPVECALPEYNSSRPVSLLCFVVMSRCYISLLCSVAYFDAMFRCYVPLLYFDAMFRCSVSLFCFVAMFRSYMPISITLPRKLAIKFGGFRGSVITTAQLCLL